MTQKLNQKKGLVAKVVSTKMQKTAVVETELTRWHPVYHKKIIRTRRFLADNEIKAKEGDLVRVLEGRPQSRLKRFRVVEIL